MQRLGSTLLVGTLVMAATGSASGSQAGDQTAVRALGDSFARAFLQKDPNSEHPCSPKMEPS